MKILMYGTDVTEVNSRYNVQGCHGPDCWKVVYWE